MYKRFLQSCKACETSCDPVFFSAGKLAAPGESGQVLFDGPLFGFGKDFRKARVEFGADFLMVPGGCGIGWNREHVRQVVRGVRMNNAQIQCRRDQKQAVNFNAGVFIKIWKKSCRWYAPIALAGETFGRAPAGRTCQYRVRMKSAGQTDVIARY